MSLYVLKPKTENKNITQNYMKGTGKNVKTVYNQNQNSLILLRGIYSVCQFLYFYNLSLAFIHYAFCFSSIRMGFC